MMRSTLVFVLTLLPLAAQDVFPFPYHIHDYDNGLRLVAVPMDQPNVVCTYIVVATGSRNEVEEGKSGFAHFFEHMMFRGSKNYTSAEQAAFFKKVGADRNAYTTDDYTAYHTTFSKDDLDDVLRMEADRFRFLEYEQRVFRTEAMAVLGEYNKNSANPINRLLEVARDNAFEAHTYRHTTMGFLRDIRRMPAQFDYSKEFFDRYYRPEYTTIVVVGDIDPDATNAMVRRHWGAWDRGSYTAPIPTEPAQSGPKLCHVKWPQPTQPWTMVAFKGPAFDADGKDMPAIDVLMALAFGQNSDFYKELYVRERKVDSIFPYAPDHTDPFLISVLARLRDQKDLADVHRRILATCARFQTELADEEALARVKSNLRYGFLSGMVSAEDVAGALAGYIARARTPDVINRVYRTYDQITAEDVRDVARRYLVTKGRTVCTLLNGEQPTELGLEEPSAPMAAAKHTLIRTGSPLIDFRLTFGHGAASDPDGMAGLANLTASVMTSGATQNHPYEEIVEAMFPMAARVGAAVDKEMTVIQGSVHKDNLEAFYGLLKDMLVNPAFADEDFERVRSNTKSFIDVGLRRSDDEETGKEMLYEVLFEGHPYGRLSVGHLDDLDRITREDVVTFYKRHFRVGNLRLGLAGDYPEGFPERVLEDLAGTGGDGQEAARPVAIPAPKYLDRNRMMIVEKPTLATGMHIGFPMEVRRGHPDWVALWLVRSWLGEHRSENSHLYQRLRELRGLNYGDYAYIEHFPRGGAQFQPPPNVARSQQVFQIWIRPVPHENAPFALKGAWYELDKLVKNGLTQAQFEATRTFLSKQVNLLVKTQDRRLGYALDSGFYGMGEFTDYVKAGLSRLTLDEVNRVVRRYLRSDRLQFVIVTDDAERFAAAILDAEATPITYMAKPEAAVLEEDKLIERLRIPMRREDVTTIQIENVFR